MLPYDLGDLDVKNSAVLTITGTVWITGDITLQNTAIMELDSSFGNLSGILIADGSADPKDLMKVQMNAQI